MYYPYYFYYRQCPPGTRPYTIKAGDTFYKLAQQFNTTVPAIISANPLVNPSFLRIGQQICIPRQPIFPPCPEGNYYTIKLGDTLYAIAQRYNVSLDDLIEANPQIDPRNLFVGQVICIPLAVPPVACPEGTEPYTIKAGDTFYAIAQEYNITVDALIETNPDVDPNALLIGQQICIPSPEPEPEPEPEPPPELPVECPEGTFVYTIKAGDTFYAIAQEYNTTVEALIDYNPDVDPDNLSIGQQICVPEAE